MRKSTDLDSPAALEEVAPRGVSTCSARRAHARHRQRRQARDLYGALHQLDDRTLREFARAHRSFSLGEIIVAVIQAAGAIARRAHARHRQRRQAMATYDALRQLDDRLLRDLGFDRSEIRSVAAEVTREAEYTRVRGLLTSHSLPSARRA